MTSQRMRAVLATTNAGKVRELAGPLADFGVDVVGLDHFPHIGDIVEDGQTFEENALIKARTVAAETGLVSIADDSGLEVDALDGAPGIHSARYGNDPAYRLYADKTPILIPFVPLYHLYKEEK